MRLSRPSHTTVVAYLALFVAIAGGTAVAAKKIGPDQLKKNAVTTKKIANGAVTTGKLANDAVTGGKLANGAVSEGKIDADAVTANKLAQNSVGTNKIRDEAVETAKIGAGAVTEGKIGNDAVVGSKVAAGSLPLGDIAQVVANVSTGVLGPIAPGGCTVNAGLAVPGLAAGDDVLVFPAQHVGGLGSGPRPGRVRARRREHGRGAGVQHRRGPGRAGLAAADRSRVPLERALRYSPLVGTGGRSSALARAASASSENLRAQGVLASRAISPGASDDRAMTTSGGAR